MHYIKLVGLKNTTGISMYRGLDISKFVLDSIYYPTTYDFCILKTEEVNIPKNKYIQEISASEYTELLRNLTKN